MRRKSVAAKVPKPSFATVFPKAGEFQSSSGGWACRIRASGVSGEPETAPWTEAIVALLEKRRVKVNRTVIMGMCAANSHRLSAKFLDGSVSAETGNYIGGARGAYVLGPKAALFIALGLGLTVNTRVFERLGIAEIPLADLEHELEAEATRAEAGSGG